MNKGIESFENQSECIRVEGGDVGRWFAPSDGGTGPAFVNAGVPSLETIDRVVEDDGYQVVTRGRGKKGSNGRGPTTGGKSISFRFEQPIEASKKRRTEDDLGDATRNLSAVEEIKSLKGLILQLVQKDEERNEEIREMRKELEKVNGLKKEVMELKKMLQKNNVEKPTYATAVKANSRDGQAAMSSLKVKPAAPVQQQRLRVEEDKCSVTINTTRVKSEKTDFLQVKKALQKGIEDSEGLEGVVIRCLRQLPGDRINVVFATEADAKKAREHSGWLTAAMPEAHVKSEEWYAIKCDMVVKRAVLDAEVEGGRTLRREVCKEFAEDKTCDRWGVFKHAI